MALITNLATSGASADLYGQGKVYNVNTADLVALGAFTTGTINLDILQPGTIVLLGRIKHSQAVAGPSISASTARVQTATTAVPGTPVNSFGSAALDVFAAVSDTAMQTFGTTTVTPVAEAFGQTSYLQLQLTTTGANFSVITAGRIQVWVRYTVLK